MLIHGVSQNSMILVTMVPITKNKRKSLSNSDTYRAIALSSIIGKHLDWVILMKERHVLKSSNLQFGFKNNLSTSQCNCCMMETVHNYNFNRSNLYAFIVICH